MPKRVLVLCADGPLQRELVHRASERFELAGVVVHSPPSPKGSWRERVGRYRDPAKLRRYLEVRAFLPAFERAAEALRRDWFPERAPPSAPVLHVPDINAAETLAFLDSARPELLLVNGTNLLRKPLLERARALGAPVLNLHTGLSPYSRGGNCNLFMLLEGRPELVGITVHHISGGIDSGDIVMSAQVPMAADDNFEHLDLRSFHFGFDALLRGAEQVLAGSAPRVRQWQDGKLFLRRTGYVYEPWHRLQANRLMRDGMVRRYLSERARRDEGVVTVGGFA